MNQQYKEFAFEIADHAFSIGVIYKRVDGQR